MTSYYKYHLNQNPQEGKSLTTTKKQVRDDQGKGFKVESHEDYLTSHIPLRPWPKSKVD
jgi:hypothetical protein